MIATFLELMVIFLLIIFIIILNASSLHALLRIYFALVSRLRAALSSAPQHAMPPEFGRKWGTECLNTRFPLPTLLCAGYSVKLT